MKVIPLTQGKSAIIDSQDYWLVSQFTWCCLGIFDDIEEAAAAYAKAARKLFGQFMPKLT